METEYMMNQKNEELAARDSENAAREMILTGTEYQQACAEIESEKKTREKAKLYATILVGGSFDSVVVADNLKHLQEILDGVKEDYSIAGIIKGHEIQFKETKAISFV